jgi:hypothetical protein
MQKQEKERKLAIIRIIAYLCKSTIEYEYGRERTESERYTNGVSIVFQ